MKRIDVGNASARRTGAGDTRVDERTGVFRRWWTAGTTSMVGSAVGVPSPATDRAHPRRSVTSAPDHRPSATRRTPVASPNTYRSAPRGVWAGPRGGFPGRTAAGAIAWDRVARAGRPDREDQWQRTRRTGRRHAVAGNCGPECSRSSAWCC
ncbi:hypothetical protein F8271_13485 [Micromonospora sp. ALFpr18c]|nr:hypothetical protein F8271_13485 [Micromonospora sp. ALFpr18c]